MPSHPVCATWMQHECFTPMPLYRRPSVVGPDHFVIMHKESDGREIAIGFIHNPTRTNLTTLGAWAWNIEHHQCAGRASPQWGTCETLEKAMAALKACWESADVQVAVGHEAALAQRCGAANLERCK